MLVQEALTEIGLRCSLDPTNVATDKTRILNSLNSQIKKLYTRHNLMAEKETFSLATVASTYLYYLDPRIMKILNMRESDTPEVMKYWALEDFEKEYPYPASTETGVPSIYVPIRKVRAKAQPTSASTISVVSSSASDVTSYFVVVKGISGGILKTERLTLTGATPVVSSNSYTSLLSITKDATNGTITATSNSGAVTNITLYASDTAKEYWEVRLHKIPDDAYTIYYTAYLIPWNLTLDEEVIQIEDMYIESLLAMVTKDLLFKQGDQKVVLWKAESEELSQEITDSDFMSKDDDQRFGFEEISYGRDFK